TDKRLAFEMVKLIVGLGTNINAADDTGNTALHTASWKGLNDVIPVLVEHGAQLNVTNKNGQTPLGIATTRGQVRELFGNVATRGGGPALKPTTDLLRKLGAN